MDAVRYNAGDSEDSAGIIQRAEQLLTGRGLSKSMRPHRGHFDAFMTHVVAMTFSNLLQGVQGRNHRRTRRSNRRPVSKIPVEELFPVGKRVWVLTGSTAAA